MDYLHFLLCFKTLKRLADERENLEKTHWKKSVGIKSRKTKFKKKRIQ